MKAVAHFAFVAAMIALLCCPSCKKPEPEITLGPDQGPDYYRQLPPGELALRKIDPSRYPDFSSGYVNRDGIEEAIRNSLSYMSKPSSKEFFPYADVTHDRAVASLHALLDVFDEAQSPEQLDALIRQRFDVYQSVGCDDHGTVLFTGYYRPIFDARLEPDAEFRYPLYAAPSNLVKDKDGKVLGMRTGAGSIIKCWTRAQIEEGAPLKGREVCWLRDRFEAYIVTVQGSGKLRLEDGSFFEIGYAANNGYEYSSIGQALINDGAIQPSDLSLQGLIRYFRENPGQMDKYLRMNQRYVFFMPRSGGPWGSLNEPVTAYRSIATDKAIYPRACPAFFVTQLPTKLGGEILSQPFSTFALDQDTGGAIRAAGRCDIFMGTGDEVAELAGRTLAEGQLYYVFIKEGGTGEIASPTPEVPATPEP